MGGKTFGVEARRLTTPQHTALFRFVESRLEPFTPFGVRAPRSPNDKASHGDLDVIMGSHASGPGFKYQFSGESSEYANLPVAEVQGWRTMAGTDGYLWSESELKDWTRDIARELGAVVWQKHRIGAIFAVPCRVIGDLASEASGNECYQVDLNIAHPDRLDFGEFVLSYGITPLFINQVIRQLSPSLKIHHEHLVISHSPYVGESVVHLELTPNVTELLEWLGLDYERWKKGFATQTEYQRWFAGLSEELGKDREVAESMEASRVRLGWIKLIDQVGPIKDSAGHQRQRIEQLEDFRDWLREIGYSSNSKGRPQVTCPGSPGQSERAVLRRMIINFDTILTINSITGETAQEGTSTTTIHALSNKNEHDSELYRTEPRPLDEYGIEVLEYFGKLDEFNRIMAERKLGMVAKVENRKRKMQNREFAMVNDSKVARDAKRAEGRWT